MQNKGEIPRDIAAKMGHIVFGCDICQAICPFNRDIEETREPRFTPDPILQSTDLFVFLNMTEMVFNRHFENSSVGEKGYQLFKRNIAIVAENIGKQLPR